MSIVTNNILNNMYSLGYIDRNENDKPTVFISSNKDYKIEMYRKEFSLWSTESSFKYLCIFDIKTILDIPVLKIILSEEDIMRLLDSVYAYLEFNMPDIYIYFNANTTNLVQTVFQFKKIRNNDKDYYLDQLIIFNLNLVNQQLIPKLSIIFNDEDDIEELLEKIYYTFIIDIDNVDAYSLNPNNRY